MWIFNLIYSLFQKIFSLFSQSKKTPQIAIVGLCNAGKTTMLNALKTGHFQQQEKAKASKKETICISGLNMIIKIFDLDDHIHNDKSDNLDFQGIVFVIDASDRSRFDEAKKEFDQIMNDEFCNNIPILILANKVDVAGSASYIDIVDAFNLKDLYNNEQITKINETRPINLTMSSVRQQFGYLSGFKWMVHFI